MQLNRTSAPAKNLVLIVFCIVLSAIITPIFATPIAEQQPNGKTLLITDLRGRKVSVPSDIQSIIALEANSLRLLSYFKSIEKVIAVEDTGHAREKTFHQFFNLATYRIAFPQLRELPSIGNSSNHEAIIAAAPDMIFSSTADVGQLDQLQQILGIPVFGIDADIELNDLEKFLDQFRIVGDVLGEEARAEELILGINGIIEDVAARTARLQEGKRAYAGGMMYYGAADLLRTTGDYDPFDFTGTINVMPTNPANNKQPYLTSLEELISRNPSYVFVDAANEMLSKGGYLVNKAVLEDTVAAFRNRDVYTTLVYKYYGTNWESQIINIYYIGKILYPDLYTDVVVEQKAEAIWKLFFNIPLAYSTVAELQTPAYGPARWF
jgi:iron complex transport system substrate-binding protein